MNQLVLHPHFAGPLSAFWASNLYGANPAHHFAFIEHFKPCTYYLQHFSAAYLYPWVVACIAQNPTAFHYLDVTNKKNATHIANYLRKAKGNRTLQEQCITTALKIEAGSLAGYLQPLFVGTTDLEFLPQEGVPFIRDVYFKNRENTPCVLADKRSPVIAAKGDAAIKIEQSAAQLANGTFWVGSNYTLVGVSEFVQSNGFSDPDKAAMEKTEQGFKEIFSNHADYPIVWVGPDKPVNYRGHDYYYPLTGHLDDFMCPLYSEGDKDVYLFAELDSAFYCGSRKADSDVIENLQRPLLKQTAVHLAHQLRRRGKELELIYLPVLWDDAGLYPYANCITEKAGDELTLHLPGFRIEGNEYFNKAASACEAEIVNRLKAISPQKLNARFIKDFNFTENLRSNKGGIHCMTNCLR